MLQPLLVVPQDRQIISRNLDVGACAPIIDQWIQICQSGHSDCTAFQEGPNPKRLIFVPENGPVRLRFMADEPPVSYIALSYCWGGYTACRTMKTNVGHMETAVTHEILPKTFRDLFSLASAIGVRFVWIDSLCIVQDDEKEWASESARMGDIYANAYLTVSAMSAPSPTVGLFRDRAFVGRDSDPDTWGTPAVTDPVPYFGFINIESGSGCSESIMVREIFPHEMLKRFTAIPKKDFPLSQRAWTLQERLLSPRIAHFTSQEILWECNSGTACECGTLRVSKDDVGLHNNVALRPLFRLAVRDVPGVADVKGLWHTIVELYSRRSITFDRDRLVALSALARSMQSEKLGRYLAGVWEADLPRALWWKPVYASGYRPRRYSAPSWSWASLEGPVTLTPFIGGAYGSDDWDKPETIRAKVLTIDFKPATINSYSDAASCSIRLLAPVVAATLCQNGTERITPESKSEDDLEFSWVDSPLILTRAHLRIGFVPDDVESVSSEMLAEGTECLVVLIQESESGKNRSIVVQETALGSGHYVRLGRVGGDPVDYHMLDFHPNHETFATYTEAQRYGMRGWDVHNFWVRRFRATFDAWFQDAEEQEITIV